MVSRGATASRWRPCSRAIPVAAQTWRKFARAWRGRTHAWPRFIIQDVGVLDAASVSPAAVHDGNPYERNPHEVLATRSESASRLLPPIGQDSRAHRNSAKAGR